MSNSKKRLSSYASDWILSAYCPIKMYYSALGAHQLNSPGVSSVSSQAISLLSMLVMCQRGGNEMQIRAVSYANYALLRLCWSPEQVEAGRLVVQFEATLDRGVMARNWKTHLSTFTNSLMASGLLPCLQPDCCWLVGSSSTRSSPSQKALLGSHHSPLYRRIVIAESIFSFH